jgi:hypothetical protein
MRDLPRGTQVVDPEAGLAFAYGAITRSGPPFQVCSTSDRLCNSAGARQGSNVRLLQPQLRNDCRLSR